MRGVDCRYLVEMRVVRLVMCELKDEVDPGELFCCERCRLVLIAERTNKKLKVWLFWARRKASQLSLKCWYWIKYDARWIVGRVFLV